MTDFPGLRDEDLYAVDEPPRPRWKPDRPLGERISRLGRWRDVDPLEAGRLWSPAEWAGFALWVGLLAGAYAVAWRRHGGGPDGGGRPAA